MPEPQSEESPGPEQGGGAARLFNPSLFFGFLVAPGVLSLITLYATDAHDYGVVSGLVLAVGSIVAGFVCGIHFIRVQKSLSPAVRWILGAVSVIGCAGAAFALGIGGCYLSFLATGKYL